MRFGFEHCVRISRYQCLHSTFVQRWRHYSSIGRCHLTSHCSPIWSYDESYEYCRLVTIHFHFWPLLATFDHLWPKIISLWLNWGVSSQHKLYTNLVLWWIVWVLQVSNNIFHVWPLLATIGHFWSFWPFLATFGHFWSFLVTFGRFWLLLTTFGPFGLIGWCYHASHRCEYCMLVCNKIFCHCFHSWPFLDFWPLLTKQRWWHLLSIRSLASFHNFLL